MDRECLYDFIYDISDGAVIINGYRGSGGDVVIPSEIEGMPVEGIADMAFSGRFDLNSVVISDSVSMIGDSAFEGCLLLTNVTIGSSVTSIGEKAFWNCDALTSVTIPDSDMLLLSFRLTG
jgi:hypothetical protein